jgi:uncharacterized membrane protein (DUF106 family)
MLPNPNPAKWIKITFLGWFLACGVVLGLITRPFLRVILQQR